MYTSIGLVALAGVLTAPAATDVPTWRSSYGSARQEGGKEGKPLAVVFGSGQQGFDGLSQQGKLSPQTRQLLAEQYIPVYVDAATPAGKELASAFSISRGTGLVISDRSGEVQAFYHDGRLTDDTLAQYLKRYASGNHVVRTTEGTTTQRVSYYPAQSGSVPGQAVRYAPVQRYVPATFGGFGGFGGGGGGC
jgi:hypothetical protein